VITSLRPCQKRMGLDGEVGGAGLQGATQGGVIAVEQGGDSAGIGVAGEIDHDGPGRSLAQRGERRGGGGVVALPAAEGGIHPEVEGDIVGLVAPRRGGGENDQ
jgi:hypothetical protein